MTLRGSLGSPIARRRKTHTVSLRRSGLRGSDGTECVGRVHGCEQRGTYVDVSFAIKSHTLSTLLPRWTLNDRKTCLRSAHHAVNPLECSQLVWQHTTDILPLRYVREPRAPPNAPDISWGVGVAMGGCKSTFFNRGKASKTTCILTNDGNQSL